MSSKNRNQRQGLTVADGTELGGAIGELYGRIGNAPVQRSNNMTAALEQMYTRILFRISLSRFKWEGLPTTVSRRWLETCLATQALAVFFKDPATGQFFATQGTPAGNFNMIGDPTEFHAVSANNMKWWDLSADPDDKECVPIWANEMRVPDMDIIRLYAKVLAETDTTIRINLKNMRQPKVAAFAQNSALTMENFLRQYDEGNPAIKIDAEFGTDLETAVKVLDLSVHPDLVVNLMVSKARLWGDAMTFLGVNNAPNTDKKERLVAAEVSGNDDVIETIRATNLEPRQIAADAINEMFGLKISVEYATDMNQALLKDVNGNGVPDITEQGAGGNMMRAGA